MSLKAPTKAEREWRAAIMELGCIACWIDGHPNTPAIQHHLIDGGQRISHLHSIPLCEPGHHQYPPKGSGKIARHPTHARFTAKYGSDEYLLEKTRELVGACRVMVAA